MFIITTPPQFTAKLTIKKCQVKSLTEKQQLFHTLPFKLRVTEGKTAVTLGMYI